MSSSLRLEENELTGRAANFDEFYFAVVNICVE